MARGCELIMAFKTCYYFLEYLVMPFKLTNVVAQFQAHMKKIHFVTF